MIIKSSAFNNGGTIPARYTVDGENISPPLSWDQIPPNTKSLSLIVDDPDAPVGIWVHWVAWNIPAQINSLPEGIKPLEVVQDLMEQGTNDFHKIGYGGPSPPQGTHRYFFKLYALDSFLKIAKPVTKQKLLQAMQGHILAEAKLYGTYSR